MANVLFKRGDTATINGTAISDGQLLYNTTTGQHYIDSDSTRKEVGKPVDTTLSTTSTNAIANNALTNSIINTTAEVSAITADNIPCGTKPVKELIQSLSSKHIATFTNLNVITTDLYTGATLDLTKYREIYVRVRKTGASGRATLVIKTIDIPLTDTDVYYLNGVWVATNTFVSGYMIIGKNSIQLGLFNVNGVSQSVVDGVVYAE